MDNDQMRLELRGHIAKKYKTQSAAASAWKLSPAFVNLVLAGKKEPNPRMLADVGIERVDPPTFYRKIKKEKSA